MDYLQKEGLKCELSDGDVIFEFNESRFNVSLATEEQYAECTITYRCADEDYERLELDDKTFIADKVNTDMENHATVFTFNDSIQVTTSFYFTSSDMLINLFAKHFEELTQSIDEALDIASDKIEENKKTLGRHIGFISEVNHQQESETNTMQVAAKA